MELLHTPKIELVRMMKENSLTVEDVVFLYSSNKVAPADVRMNAPSLCDKLLAMLLRQRVAASAIGEKAAAGKQRQQHDVSGSSGGGGERTAARQHIVA